MKKICLFLILIFVVGIYSSSFSQFVVQNTPATNYMTSISSPTNNVAWASGDSQQVIRTNDAGLNWVLAKGDLPTNLRFFNIWAIDSITAHICVSNAFFTTGYIYKTSNGGINWVKTYEGGAFINATSFINSQDGFAFGDPADGRWTLLKTTNGGNSWDSTGLRLNASNTELGMDNSLFYDGNKIWFGSQSGKIYSSTNSGVNWNTTQTSMRDVQKIYFNDPSTGSGLAVSNFYHNGVNIIKTGNGLDWNPITFFKNDERIPGVSGISGTINYWIIFPKSIYKTSDNGLTWSMIYNNLTDFSFKDITISRTGSFPRSIFAIRHDKKIIYGNSDITSGIIPSSNEFINKFELSQNFPNPFNPTTILSFNINKQEIVSLQVYDDLGRLIKEIVKESLNAGHYNFLFNGSELNSGIYYYKLVVGLTSITKKMILIK